MTDQRTLRKCIGSERFGIEPHEAPVDDFPKQPSQKDGLGRMCKTHWNQYTAGLARDAKARKAAGDPDAHATTLEPETASTAEPERGRTRKGARTAPTAEPTAAEAQADTG